jgi:hypothetical protein
VYLPREEILQRDNQLSAIRSDNMQLKSDLNKALTKLLATETKLLKIKSLKQDIKLLQNELYDFK